LGQKSPEELFKERKERLEKAYRGKQPDRVPFTPSIGIDLAARYAGVTVADFCFNWDTQVEVALKWGRDFNVDGVDGAPTTTPGLEMYLLLLVWADYSELAPRFRFLMGPYHDVLKDRYSKWPGRELGPDVHPQFVGAVVMEPSEYGKLAEDPINFINSVILPRAFESLSNPLSPKAFSALIKLGYEALRYAQTSARIAMELNKLGYFLVPMGHGYAPLDVIGDFLRHVTHILVDLRRYPDDVLRAVEAITPHVIKAIKASTPPVEVAKARFGTDIVTVFYPLHLHDMLPPKLFETFYWPYLKKTIEAVIEMGAIPALYVEGDFTRMLHYLLELPKGRVYAFFERTDLRTVRKVLGDHIIIGGGLPTSLVAHGSKEKVYEEACKLLNEVKEPGGFIFRGSQVALPIDTRIENIWALVEAVKNCGVYP